MNEITCDLCMDLIPLVQDGAASGDSREAVMNHIRSCPSCRALYDKKTPPAVSAEQAFHKFRRQARIFFALLMMFGISLGLGLTGSSELFYNSLIMPVTGALGYALFRGKAAYLVPGLLLITFSLLNVFRLLPDGESLDMSSILMWTAIYSAFALAGILTAGLLRCALRKSETGRKLQRAAALAAALLLIGGLGAFANALTGNPVSRMLAAQTVKSHLAERYAGTDFFCSEIRYSFKDGLYYAYIQSPDSVDRSFTLLLDKAGELKQDDYEKLVQSGENTARRLNQAYRELADSVFESPSFPFNSPISFGELEFTPADYAENEEPPASPINRAELTPDGLYDIRALGEEAGLLTVYVDDATVSAERAAEILLELRRLLDQGGVPFSAIHFVLEHELPEGGGVRPEERVEALRFPYEDIYEDGMTERVQRANEAAKRFYEEAEK